MSTADPLATLAETDSGPIVARLRLKHVRGAQDVVALAQREGLKVDGFFHAVRVGRDVHSGEFVPDAPADPDAAFAEYGRTHIAFYDSALAHAERAASKAQRAADRRAHRYTASQFRALRKHVAKHGAAVLSVRVIGSAKALKRLRDGDPAVAGVDLPEPVAGGEALAFSAPQVSPDGGDLLAMMVPADCSVETEVCLPDEGPPPPEPTDYESLPPDPSPPDYAELPPDGGELGSLPDYSGGVPENLSYFDGSNNSYYVAPDNNSVWNGDWAPTRGASWVGWGATWMGNYGKRITYQNFQWNAGATARFRRSPAKGLEMETLLLGTGPRGCGQWCRWYFGRGVAKFTSYYGYTIVRGRSWDSSLPYAYLDLQVGSDVLDEEASASVGSTQPEQIAEGRNYYYMIQYDYGDIVLDNVKINAQLYNRSCSAASALCNVFKVATVKVLPFQCGAETRNYNYFWRFDGRGSENEQCYKS